MTFRHGPLLSISRPAFLWGAAATVTALALAPMSALAATLDPRYVAALQCVDDFLTAWRRRDGAAGLALVSSQAQKKSGAGAFRAFLIGTSSPQNAAFEVLSGASIDAARFRFSIKLYYAITGGGLDVPNAQPIYVRRTGTTWQIDSLPAS